MPDIFAPSETDKEKSKDVSPDIDSSDKQSEDDLIKKEKNLLNFAEGTDIHKVPGHTHNIFTGFCLFPDKVGFESADSGEKVVLLLRRHPITNIPWIIVAFIMIIAPSLSTLVPFFDKLSSGFQIIIILVWYLISIAYVLENFLEWFFNVNLITTERVIDVDFVNLLYREVTEAELEKIQEPTFEIGGAARSFFNYGDVLIQTAAEVSRIEFQAVPNPDKVVQILRNLGIREEVDRLRMRYKDVS